MFTKLTAAACLLAASILTAVAVAAASPAGSKQRIVITNLEGEPQTGSSWPHWPPARSHATPERPPPRCWSQRLITRQGQSIEIDSPVLRTFVGKHGTFTWRASIEWVDAGNGYAVGTGTWTIVRGTGVYQHLEGNGHVALADTGDASLSSRAEGLVDLHR